MTKPYRIGFCPCCGKNIMIQDVDGSWNSFKPTFRQVDLAFENGPNVRTIMCSKCFENGFDKEELVDTITHEYSQACVPTVSRYIQSLGGIKNYTLARSFQGESVAKKKASPADTGLNKIHE